ncbi:hypothetical protein COO91_04533 [Nostoc flagelliforme CCNUN1]|uniref:Uncharacterized protein n=1 Tax=Nostoc flagelliforme CCNUN1 TaxID=2038116 RepID=A0A2K8STA5_9NOSO|nr:hypothetical protein COO91_04533 [Nostoc flagelliforme CCNUN1]
MSLGIDWAFFGDSWALIAQVAVKHSVIKNIGDTVARKNLRSPLALALRSPFPDWQ